MDPNQEGDSKRSDKLIETEQQLMQGLVTAERESSVGTELMATPYSLPQDGIVQELKMQIRQREADQMQLQEEVHSLQKKLDSLVKFLEDERAQRKKAEAEVNDRDDVIQELRGQIK